MKTASLFPELEVTDIHKFAADCIVTDLREVVARLDALPLAHKVNAINGIRALIHAHSPFKSEPVDFVRWVPVEKVTSNDYNPNSVAPPEMKLLEVSILEDGYTQPVVSWERDGINEVVDGFHRNRVGRESKAVATRIHGYLPLVVINADRVDLGDRMASTIRHNRARGKHRVEAMSDIVVELKRRNWSDEKIAKNLGMEPDEILRLMQITGLQEMFADQDFSKAWDIEDFEDDAVLPDLEGDAPAKTESQRIYHTHEKWECYPAGFYDSKPPEGMTAIDCEKAYRDFLAEDKQFRAALELVITEWPNSCEHYLTNEGMNRIAWLGQASMCVATGIPSRFRGGFFLLTEEQQAIANNTALEYLNIWLNKQGRVTVDLEGAGVAAEVNLY